MSQDSHVYTPNLVRIVREGGIPLAFSLSIRERTHRGHIAHGIGTTEGPHALRPFATRMRAVHAPARPRAVHAPARTPPLATARTAAREQSRNRSRGQSGLFMRMQKTPSKAL